MKSIIGFGEKVEGYDVSVLNEREIRASAGILFLFALISFFIIVVSKNFAPIKYFILIFVLDFIIRVFVNPRYAPTLIIGRLIVIKQMPEYTGAPQKKFAWIIGLLLGTIMLVLMPIMNTYSAISGIICLICLIFLFFESAFGICLGCIFYNWMHKNKAKHCPGNSCEIKQKHEIQKITGVHLLILAGLILYITVSVILLKDNFREMPQNLWVKIGLKKEEAKHF
ncbi:MAG: hypothetical protein A2275_02900 [Bacteroidetes bacterium RIFOXYA12_FULL_35_11]|nr:MAG: hypothetical protein A2X01_01855 [Bacteroidetes bacterium GWF2_35_48]OFY75728.1 MAG: hypothetical protein A2275_02900 [Bacteroidetes bacterium RIFOXYA12_FULL_35_11]OFY97513.1 MAG: hypothetical protein A2491_00470 [Bacteroidetes bacterium RIFOXYC12_FULL_35_7]OFY97710.1 MAG: hypothetical protein A2309_13670 [Bacteroidetes bacterium RIFOXYB2_FULL_35_7]HBX51523.1 DUF4395 domain-containing protein [Bacteroidales bacterium]